MHILNKEQFRNFSILGETNSFALIHDAKANPFDKESNYYIIYKPFETIEVEVGSFPTALQYLSLAEEALVSIVTKDKNTEQKSALSH